MTITTTTINGVSQELRPPLCSKANAVRNRVMSRMSAAQFGSLGGVLELVTFERGQRVQQVNAPLDRCPGRQG
jgi:hypothetical protein